MTTTATDRKAIADLASSGDSTITAAKAAADAAALEAAAHQIMEDTMAQRASEGETDVSVDFSSSALGVDHADLQAAAAAEKATWEGLGYTVTLTDDGSDTITVDADWDV